MCKGKLVHLIVILIIIAFMLRAVQVGWGNFIYFQDALSMRGIVIRAIPGIMSTRITDFERVNKIREWVNSQVVWAPRPVDTDLRMRVSKKTAFEMYKIFNEERSWFDCGTYSLFLQKLYLFFGYESYIIDIGRENQFKHTVVAVSIRDGRKRKLVVEDPYYNLTYVDKDKPLDLFSLIRTIQAGRSVTIKESSGIGFKTICHKTDTCNLTGKRIIRKTDEIVLYRDRFDTQIIRNNLPSFLYASNIMYGGGMKYFVPIQEKLQLLIFKLKMISIADLAPRCSNMNAFLLAGRFSTLLSAVRPDCMKKFRNITTKNLYR